MKLIGDQGGFPRFGIPVIVPTNGGGDVAPFSRVDYLTAAGVSTYITLAQVPATLKIWKNGLLLFQGTDYTLSGVQANLTLASTTGDKFAVEIFSARPLAAAALSPILVNFDSNATGPHITLSVNNTTATADASGIWSTTKSKVSQSSGKRIFEMQMVTIASNATMTGLCDAAQVTTNFITNGATTAVAIQESAHTLRITGVTNANYGTPANSAAGDYRQWAIDFSAKKIWVTAHRATSSTSLATVNSGSVAFTTQSGLVYPTGHRITATSSGTGEWMSGTVSSYSGTTLTVTMDSSSGSGTHADWKIDMWIGGGSPDAGTSPTFTYTSAPTLFAAASLFTSQQIVYNGSGSFVLTPQNAISFTPWDN